MARCEICDKTMQTGRKISITRSQVSRRWKRNWKPNVKKIKIKEDNGTVKTLNMCTSCLRNNQKTKTFTRAI